ncbi:MAG: RNA methyltransferase [Bdellovibrionaceae bacterium]|nr:RNA methyltransferase [Pseudobdellovibrionaceae bacterium]
MDRCFIVVPPGFEEDAERELREIWPDLLDSAARPHAEALPEIRRERGGLEFETDLFTAVQLNFFLKSASRVLYRLAEFRARDFPKLHERLRRLDVKAWVGEGPVRVEAAAAKSRLGHEKRVVETALKAWGLREDPAAEAGLYLRLDNDLCTVSLDTTGEHLHRRGVSRLRGEAPLRETLAAFCLGRMIGDTPAADVAKVDLIDPMCGSGTFLSEAMTLWSGNFRRSYAFQSYRRLPKLFRQENFAANYRLTTLPPFRFLHGRDVDAGMVAISASNLERARALLPASQADLLSLDLGVEDLYAAAAPADLPGDERWVICNPPYGERLKAPPVEDLHQALLRRWKPRRLGLLIPEHQARVLLKRSGKGLIADAAVKNGGIDCRFLVWDLSGNEIRGTPSAGEIDPTQNNNN